MELLKIILTNGEMLSNKLEFNKVWILKRRPQRWLCLQKHFKVVKEVKPLVSFKNLNLI